MSNFNNNFQDIYSYEDYLEFDLDIHLRREVMHLFIPLGSHRPHRTAYGLKMLIDCLNPMYVLLSKLLMDNVVS